MAGCCAHTLALHPLGPMSMDSFVVGHHRHKGPSRTFGANGHNGPRQLPPPAPPLVLGAPLTPPRIHKWRIPHPKGKHVRTPVSTDWQTHSALMATPPPPPRPGVGYAISQRNGPNCMTAQPLRMLKTAWCCTVDTKTVSVWAKMRAGENIFRKKFYGKLCNFS